MGKTKFKTTDLPQRILIGEKEIFDKKTIAKPSDGYFINIWP